MVDNIKPEVIKKTQDLLIPYFKKPPLTKKLLQKPPFRFLHDIILSIIKETGFLTGLFSDSELNADNVKDKNAKIKFLNKLIYVVESTTGDHLSIKTSKIIAGLEPTKTNELLQLIGIALQKQLSSVEAIKQYNINSTSKHKTLTSTKNCFKRKPTTDRKLQKTNVNMLEKSSVRNIEWQTCKEKNYQIKVLQQQTNQNILNQSEDEVFDNKKNIISSISDLIEDKAKIHMVNETPIISMQEKIKINNSLESQSRKQQNPDLNCIVIEPEDLKMTTDYSEISSKIREKRTPQISSEIKNLKKKNTVKDLNTSNIHNEKKNLDSNLFLDSSQMNVPSSTRPAASKLHTKLDAVVQVNELRRNELQNTFRKKSTLKRCIINMNTNQHKKYNINGAKNTENSFTIDKQNMQQNFHGQEKHYLNEEHGYLVAQILETQNDLTNNSIQCDIISTEMKTKSDLSIPIGHVQLTKDIENLRCNIQQLTSASNPLGKLTHLIQENIEIMQKEYFFWINQNISLNKFFNIKKKISKKYLEDIKLLLIEKTTGITEECNQIQLLKIDILKNNDKIKKLLNK